MTDLLRDTLREQAQTETPPHFDVEQIMRDGDARAGRGRIGTGLVAAGIAGVVALGGVALSQMGADDGRDLQVADQRDGRPAFAERRVTYAEGSVIHYGVDSIDVGQKVVSFVQTDDGFVFMTPDGSVHLADGSAREIGRTDAEAAYLKSDDSGSLVAWVEFAPGERPTLVVFDTAARDEVLRTSDGTTPDMTAFRDSHAAFVYAVDDGTVYWRTGEGMVAVDAATGESELVLPGATGFSVLDVAAGQFAYMTGEGERMHVGADPTKPGVRMPWGWDGDLSPDARFVASDQSDKAAVFDGRTGEDVTPRAPGYEFRSFYSWLDESRVAMIAIEDAGGGQGLVDLLECSVVDGTCTVAQDDVVEFVDDAESVDLTLPVGERMF